MTERKKVQDTYKLLKKKKNYQIQFSRRLGKIHAIKNMIIMRQ